jgi:hypothetical protein
VPVAGVPEIFKNGENAYISKDHSIEALWECLVNYQSDRQSGRLLQITKNAEATYRQYFSEAVVREQLSEYYDFIISDYRAHEKQAAIAVEDINNFIKPLYDRICQRQGEISDFPLALRRVWQYSLIDKLLKPGKAYIWGAGK